MKSFSHATNRKPVFAVFCRTRIKEDIMNQITNSLTVFRWLSYGLLFFTICLGFSGGYLKGNFPNLLFMAAVIYFLLGSYWSILGFRLKGTARKIVITVWCLALFPLIVGQLPKLISYFLVVTNH